MNYSSIQQQDQEEDEQEQLSFNRSKYWIFSLLSLPFLYYLFIYLPTSGPSQINIPPLSKYNRIPIHLVPSTKSSSTQTSSHESYHSFKTIHNDFQLSKTKPSQRLILIGDIHGSYTQLCKLLSKINYTSSPTDSIVMLGDFLSKGPDSLKVLELAMQEDWFGVLGNHELSILSKYNGFKSVHFGDNETYITKSGLNGKFDKELYIARKLTPEQVEYISSMPLVLGLGPVPMTNSKDKFVNPVPGVASHLGLFYDEKLDEQKVGNLLNIEKDWYRDYNDHEKTISKKNRNVVYYGHHASVGLNLRKFTKGLDSGCVYGGELSAMVIWVEELEEKGTVVYKQELVSVKC